jgi:hypothetical protein
MGYLCKSLDLLDYHAGRIDSRAHYVINDASKHSGKTPSQTTSEVKLSQTLAVFSFFEWS